MRSAGFPDETLEELLKMLEERLKEQTEEHNGGNYWIGTHGISPFGNDGYNPNGIRVGGVSKDRAALRVAGERTYRDFRDDNMLDIRQFQMAFRRLCHYSDQNGQDEEFDVDRTIHDTCQKAGILQIRYKKPRRNTIKVLLLIDSGGSMDYHSQLCSRLFQAASRSNRFKELRVYYFHNCPKAYLYTNPTLEKKYQVPMETVLRNCDKDFKVLLLGDDVVNKTIPLILCAEENVEGNHGATIGALDDDTLFYFASRGMDEKTAERVMTRAKRERICRRIPDAQSREETENLLKTVMNDGQDD